MCHPAAIAPAVGAIGAMQGAQQQNKALLSNYKHQLKVRKTNWLRERSLYGTKKAQYEQEVDLANIAAQRAYSRTQQQLNNAQALAIIQNQDDFKELLQAEGLIEASAAERGVGGRSLARALVLSKGDYGVKQALRSRGLANARYSAKESNKNVRLQLKSYLNRSFGKVAIQPTPDLAPPKPVLQNPGMELMLGLGQALGAGVSAKYDLDNAPKYYAQESTEEGDD